MFSRKLRSAEENASQINPAENLLPRRTVQMLGITVLLSQLPLLLHLPLWLTLPGIGLTFAKFKSKSFNKPLLPQNLTIVFVLLSVLAVFAHYGFLFGRDPCVAFLFLLLSFKYVETKRNYDASLLIVLCAFILITQFFFRQTLLSAMIAVPSIYFIGLSLFTLQRGMAETDTRIMVHTTAKLFLQAMPIALILFVAVPRISQAPWQGAGSDQATTGLSSTMSPGSFASLSKSNEVAFRVEFDGPAPAPQERYWRGPVLTGFDGYDWFVRPQPIRNDSSSALNKVAVQDNQRSIDYTVTMGANYQPWLLALDTPSAIPALGSSKKFKVSINDELQINTSRRIDQPLRYRAQSTLTDQFVPAKKPARATLVTTSSNPRARAFAKELRTRYPDDAQLAQALLRWFNTEPFHYTLSPPKLGRNSIDDFIFNSRRGFCEHYAGSFVFLLRAAGIPARVVTGYQGGEMSDGYMIVRQSDAHAWTEAYIDSRWQRLDPTAAVSPQRIEQGASEALLGDSSQSLLKKIEFPFFNTVSLKWDAINFAWQRMVIGFDSENQNAMWKKIGIEKPSAWMIVIGFIAAACIWALIILKPFSDIGREKLSPCEKYWRKLAAKLDKHGLPREPGETIAAYLDRASQHWPQYRTQLESIKQSYCNGVYSANSSDAARHRQQALNIKREAANILKL